MSIVYSTGPVENAAGNASISTWVKILNLSRNSEIQADIKVYKLNGQKTEIGSSSFSILPDSSDFDVFDITDVVQYEVQIKVSDGQNALISVWGKDANADLVAAQRFVQNELNYICEDTETNTAISSKTKSTAKSATRTNRKKTRR